MAGREGMMRPESSCAATPIAGRVRGGEMGREGEEEEEGEDETNTRPSILLWREEKGWRFEEQEEDGEDEEDEEEGEEGREE